MTGYSWLLWLHITAACVWAGGMISFGFVLMALVKSGAGETVTRAAARTFARVSWVALAVLVATGLEQMHVLHLGPGHRPLAIKLALVAVLVVVTAVHHVFAHRGSRTTRRFIELSIVLLTLAILRQALEI